MAGAKKGKMSASRPRKTALASGGCNGPSPELERRAPPRLLEAGPGRGGARRSTLLAFCASLGVPALAGPPNDARRSSDRLERSRKCCSARNARQPLTRPSATLSPSDGERDGVRGFRWIVRYMFGVFALKPGLQTCGGSWDSKEQRAGFMGCREFSFLPQPPPRFSTFE
jgi:hypothetical protein